LVQEIGRAFRGAGVAYTRRRGGRKMRVHIGDTEMRANNSVELHGLLALVIAVEQRLTAPEMGNK